MSDRVITFHIDGKRQGTVLQQGSQSVAHSLVSTAVKHQIQIRVRPLPTHSTRTEHSYTFNLVAKGSQYLSQDLSLAC